MNLSGKKLKNFVLGIRYLLRAAKNLIFLASANRKIGDEAGAVLVIYRRWVPIYWFIGDPGLKDRVAYRSLKQHGFRTRVLFDPSIEDLRSIPERLIWFNPHHFVFAGSRKTDGAHSKELSELISIMEMNGRDVIPSSKEILFWENKLYMHEQMSAAGIRHPQSITYNTLDANDFDSLSQKLGLPFLIKLPDGYSSNGLFLIKNISDFKKIVPLKNVVVQEFLNITMDLRLIMVEGSTASFYWRKNPKEEQWRPTATSGGATVQFTDLPSTAETLGKAIYSKFGLRTFGADICWRNDDLDSEPYVLEFSPIYQPNPIPNTGLVSRRYSDFKERTVFKYDQKFEILVSELISKQLLQCRSKIKY